MLKRIIILLSITLVANLSTGLMDSINFHYSTSIPARKGLNAQTWQPSKSWENKYKKDTEGVFIVAPESWYYKTFNISYKERFPLSATLFVAATDAWHFLKTLSSSLNRIIIVLLGIWIWGDIWDSKKKWLYGTFIWIVIFIIQSIGFHLTYTIL